MAPLRGRIYKPLPGGSIINHKSQKLNYLRMSRFTLHNHMAIARDRLYSLTRDRRGAYGRAIVAYLARKLTGSLVKDIARHFQREPMTISEAVIKIESLMEKDMELARRIEDMRNNLMKRGKKKYLITVA